MERLTNKGSEKARLSAKTAVRKERLFQVRVSTEQELEMEWDTGDTDEGVE